MIRVANPQQLPAQWMCKQCVFLWSKLLMRVQLGSDNDRGASLWTLQCVALCTPEILDLQASPLWMRSFPALHLLPIGAGWFTVTGLQSPSAVSRDCRMEPQLLGALVTRTRLQELQALSWAPSNKCAHLMPWISFSPHGVKFPGSQTPSNALSKANIQQGETSLTWGKFLAHNVTSACRHARAHTRYC